MKLSHEEQNRDMMIIRVGMAINDLYEGMSKIKEGLVVKDIKSRVSMEPELTENNSRPNLAYNRNRVVFGFEIPKKKIKFIPEFIKSKEKNIEPIIHIENEGKKIGELKAENINVRKVQWYVYNVDQKLIEKSDDPMIILNKVLSMVDSGE